MDPIWACELEYLRNYCDRVLMADPETEQSAIAFFMENPQERQILAVDGDTATIEIRGTLTNKPSFVGRFLGFVTTSYTDLQAAIEAIQADDSVKNVRLVVDSPGGNLTGLDETWMALRELAKSRAVVAENHGLMASAAYWLATAADRIVATSPAAETGSIGVYMLATDYSKMDAARGIKDIRIVSKNAPLKNPDPATAEGLKAYQARLDAIERVFISRVAEGRGISTEKVEKDFGRGAVLIASDPDASKPSALSVGMIDGVVGAGRKNRWWSSSGQAGAEAGDFDPELQGEAGSTVPVAGTPPFKDFPIVDRPWDSAAAVKRVRTKTGSQEKPTASYRQAFFWFDPANTENFGAYKLPFVDVVDGQLKAVRRAIFAAKGAMAGARGQKPDIPAADVGAVNAHIDRYVKKIEKEDKEKQAATTATAVSHGKGQNMKFADLAASDPELHAEITEMIAVAKTEGKNSALELIATVKPVLTGDSPAYIKDLALKVLAGEATESELKIAREAYDLASEAAKQAAAQAETDHQGATPAPGPEAGGTGDGEVKTEDDHHAAVARLKAARGQEAN